MKKIQKKFKLASGAYRKDEAGATAIEYGLIAAATGLVLIATMPLIQTNMTETYKDILDYFNNV